MPTPDEIAKRLAKRRPNERDNFTPAKRKKRATKKDNRPGLDSLKKQPKLTGDRKAKLVKGNLSKADKMIAKLRAERLARKKAKLLPPNKTSKAKKAKKIKREPRKLLPANKTSKAKKAKKISLLDALDGN